MDSTQGTNLSTKRVKPSSALVRIGKRMRPFVNRFLAKNSRVGDLPLFESSSFPFTTLLEEHADIIAAEAHAILLERNGIHPVSDVSPDHKRIAHDKRWKSFFLIGYGYRFDHNCARCPQTTKILEQIPGLNSGFFSIMEAGTEIPTHRGVTKAVLTCHLGLVIPNPKGTCAIKVRDETYHWQLGKTLVFDDTFQHEAWNHSNSERVILLLQFKRPMNLRGRIIGRLFLTGVRISSFVQQGRRNIVEKDRALGLDASSSPMSVKR